MASCAANPVNPGRPDALRARFLRVWGRSREVLRPTRRCFLRFYAVCALALSQCSECSKTTVLMGRNTLRKHCALRPKLQKSPDESFETSSPRRSSQKRVVGLTGLVFGRVWASPGPVLGLSEALLASSWALLGVCWPSFERLSCALGRIWAPMSASRLVFTGFRVAPDRVLEGSGGIFRCDFRRQCVHYRRDPSMAFPWAFRSPLAARRYVRSTWNQIFKGFFGLFFSYRKFASIFCCFFAKFAWFFKSRPSNFMRPRNVSWPSTPFNAFRKNHQKSSKNLPKILPKPFPKPRKIDPKSQKIVAKTQDNLRCVKNSKK